MAEIEIVGGRVDSAGLGTTLMHEHIFVVDPEIRQNHPQGWDEEALVAAANEKLRALKARGVDTLVDLTVIGTGRHIPRIQRALEGTGLQVVVATGLYTYHDVPMHFHFRGPGTILEGPEPMLDLFVGDIEEGIAGTGVKAGILKCATDEAGMTPGVERVIRAVAQAHRRTGVPISTHTHALSRTGLAQQDVLREEGVDLGRVIIGHSGDTTDLGYLEQLIDNGSYIGMDRFGIDVQLPFEDRVDTVARLCERGHADRMVLSQDAAAHFDWLDPEVVAAVLPRWHYTHVLDDVVPALLERGVSERQIDRMLVVNPSEIFARQGGY